MALNTSEVALLDNMETDQQEPYDPAKSVQEEISKREKPVSNLYVPQEGIQVAGKWHGEGALEQYPYKGLRGEHWMGPAIERKEEIAAEKAKIELMQDLKRAERPGEVIDFYGSFDSVAAFSDAVLDPNTNTYTGMKIYIEPNNNITGQKDWKDRTVDVPDGLTKEEILDFKDEVDSSVRKTGDLTYRPQRPGGEVEGILPFQEGLLAVDVAERTVVPQTLRAFGGLLPIGAGWRASKLAAKATSPIGKLGTPGKIAQGIITVGAFTAVTAGSYKVINDAMKDLVGSDFDKYGWGQFLFKMQEAEIQSRGLDRSKVRTLTAEQYAQLIDPTFASYWTKFANTLAENTIGTLTFMGPAGFSMLTRGRVGKYGELEGLAGLSISGNRNAYIKELHKEAMDNLKKVNADRVENKLSPLKITAASILNEARLVAKDRKVKMKEQIKNGVVRFIYGFRETQLADQFLNRKLFWAELALAEVGAAGTVSLASYYSWMETSGRTEDVDKLPFLMIGAVGGQFTSPVITSPLSPVRWATWMTGGIARLANMGRLKEMTDFLEGKIDSFPEGLSKEEIKGLKKLKEKIGVMDQEMAGKVVRSVQMGIELTNGAVELSKRVARETGDNSLILDHNELISSFVELETVAQLEGFLLKEVLSGRSTSEALSATTEKLLKARKLARQKSDNVLKKLILLGKSDKGVLDVPEYNKLKNALENSMIGVEEETAIKHNMIMNDLLNYEAYEALDSIVENPMQGNERIRNIREFLQTPEGSDFKINIHNTIYHGKEAANQLNILAIEQINQIHKINVDKTIAAKVASGEKESQFVSKNPPNLENEINPMLILESSGNKFARLIDNRWENAKSTTERMYKAAWKGSNKHKVDVTDLYTVLYDDVADNIDTIRQLDGRNDALLLTRQMFDTSTRRGMKKYITEVGDGDYANGMEIIKDLIKEGNTLKGKLTLDDLSSPQKFAKAMTNEAYGDDIQGILGQTFKLEILTPDLNRGLKNLQRTAGRLKLLSEAGQLDSRDAQRLSEYTDIIQGLDATIKDAMSEADQVLLMKAEDYWKRNVLAIRETKLWQNSRGNVKNNDFSPDSVTGLVHERDPASWAGRFWDDIRDMESAQTAWREFDIMFPRGADGSPEQLLRESAINAIDDAAIAKGIAGLEFDVTPLPIKGIDPVSEIKRAEVVPTVDEPEVVVRKKGQIDKEITMDVSQATSGMKQKVDWLREASRNEYFSGSHDLYEKLGNAVKYSSQAKNEINWSLKELAKVYKDKDAIIKTGYLAKLKTGKALILTTLGEPLKNLDKVSPGRLIEQLLRKPDQLESVKLALIDEFGDEEQAKFFLKGLVAKGVHELSTMGIRVGRSADAAIPVVEDVHDPAGLVRLLEDNEEFMTELFGKEHVEDLLLFSRFMLKFTPEPDPKAAETLGYGGTFKKSARFNLSHASIISRVYAAESGRTSFRYIGAEAVLGVLMNTDNDVLAAIFLDEKLAGKVVEFLIDPTTSIRDTKGNVVSWVHNLAGLSQALGEAVVATAESIVDEDVYWGTEMQKIYGRGFIQPKVADLPKGKRRSSIQEYEEDDAYRNLQHHYDRRVTSDIWYVIQEAKEAAKDKLFEPDLNLIEDAKE